jgi:hypothetical protein
MWTAIGQKTGELALAALTISPATAMIVSKALWEGIFGKSSAFGSIGGDIFNMLISAITGGSGTTIGAPTHGPPFPIPGMANGFNGWVTSPQLFMAGERGPEHVQVTPVTQNAYNHSGGNSYVFNITGSNAGVIGDTVLHKIRASGL